MSKKEISELSNDQLIRLEFNRRFFLQELPTEPFVVTLAQTAEVARQEHYRKIAEIIEEPAFQAEISDWKRRLMRQLAMGLVTGIDGHSRDMTELEKQSWRQVLIEVEREMEILKDRASYKDPVKSLRSPAAKI